MKPGFLSRPGWPRFEWGGGLLAAILLSAAGCVVGPRYDRPSGTSGLFPQNFLETNHPAAEVTWAPAAPGARLPRDGWWKIFGDEELNRIESLATKNNESVRAMAARLEQARAELQVSRSAFFPHLSFNPEWTRQRTSANQFERNGGFTGGRTFSTWSVPLDAGWEADLWGRVGNSVRAAGNRFDAFEEDLIMGLISLQAEVAIHYFEWRGLGVERKLVEQAADAYQRSFELTKNRRAGGIATDLDVSQAETQLKSAQAQLPAIDRNRARLHHALAVLCGSAPGSFSIQGEESPTATQARIPELLPSELLERRPDIAAAERRVSAANAEIGIATAAFFPRVRFRGLAGLQSADASTLVNWPSRFWAVGPSIEIPIFTGGRNRAGLRTARAAYDAAVSEYRQKVLSAFEEVEDQLAAQRLIREQRSVEESALQSARKTLEIANHRYEAGLVTFLEVATAQTSALSRERVVSQLKTEQLAALVALAKALGGGWEAADGGARSEVSGAAEDRSRRSEVGKQ